MFYLINFLISLLNLWIITNADVSSNLDTIIEYNFLRSECLQNVFTESSEVLSLGSLSNKNLLNYQCLPSNGIQDKQNKFSSLNTIQNIKSFFTTKTDYTIEFWYQPLLNLQSNSEILSFGIDIPSSQACSNNFLVIPMHTYNITMLYIYIY